MTLITRRLGGVVLCGAAWLALTGCNSRGGSGASASVSSSTGSVNGISWEVRSHGGSVASIVDNNSAHITCGPTDVEIKDGRLTVNGKAHGAVKSGDKVWVDEDGNVTVNGEARQPVSG
jgi:hypothetical protein